MTEVDPETVPALTRFQCGHGTAVSHDGVGDVVWLRLYPEGRDSVIVGMKRHEAQQLADALADSASP